MNEDSLLNLSNRMKNDFYVGVVGSVRSGKSTFINSFFKLMVLPKIDDEFIKNKILDELPQTAAGRQIMTVEPKFIPSTSLELNINDTLMNVRLVDCVGEIIPSSEGYGSDVEPRLVKTPWFDEAIPFKEAAQIGTEKVIFNHSNLGIYITSDGSFNEFKRADYEKIENNLIPKIINMNKPFVIILNTKDPKSVASNKLCKALEEKWNTTVIAINALELTEDDCNKILSKALEEFPIADLELMLPEYIEAIGDDIPLKLEIDEALKNVQVKYKRVKEVNMLCEDLRKTKLFSNVTLNLLEPSTGEASIDLELDDSKYKEIIDYLLGDNANSKGEFISYLYKCKKANAIYEQVNDAIKQAEETGYGVSIPRISDMKLLAPEVVKKNGMYGVKLSAKAPCIHMIAVNLEASFTPIIGSEEQSKMLMESLNTDQKEEDLVWNTEFFGKKLCDIVNDSMKSKVKSIPEKSKDKIKNVLDKIMNSERNNLIAIIL